MPTTKLGSDTPSTESVIRPGEEAVPPAGGSVHPERYAEGQ